MANGRYAAERAKYVAHLANQEALRCVHMNAGTRDGYPAGGRTNMQNRLWSDPEDGYTPVYFDHKAVHTRGDAAPPTHVGLPCADDPGKVCYRPAWADPTIRDACGTEFPATGGTIANAVCVPRALTGSLFAWNQHDATVNLNRVSHDGAYDIDPASGLPLNPAGRTGVRGRGLLGRFGVNHAADPIVTRVVWHDDTSGVLQFVAITRTDTGAKAIPGGMVEPGMDVSQTLRKEFAEEAASGLRLASEGSLEGDALIKKTEAMLADVFQDNGMTVYKGYVDDDRNTDNAWMETVVKWFHIESDHPLHDLKLKAGSDASNVEWVTVGTLTRDVKDGPVTRFVTAAPANLFASHTYFVAKMLRRCKEMTANTGGISTRGGDTSDKIRVFLVNIENTYSC